MKKPPLTLTLEQLQMPGVIEMIQTSSIWTVASVKDVPEIHLADWQVMQLPNGSRHLVGCNMTSMIGRVSSSIVAFDSLTRRAESASGRVYQLQGRTGSDGDGQYVWRFWCSARDIATFDDVSAQVQAEIDAVQASAPSNDQ